MGLIQTGIRSEVLKLFGQLKYKGFLIVAFMINISIGLLGKTMNGLIGLAASNMPLTVLNVTTSFILPLVVAMAAADLFTAEQESGTIKAVLLRPVSRIRVFSFKVLAIGVYALFFLFVGFVTSLAWEIVFDDANRINVMEMFLAYFVSLVPILSLVLYNTVIAQLSKSASGTVIISIFGYIMMIVIGTVLPNLNPMLFPTYMNWYKSFIGAVMPLASIVNSAILLVAYILLLFAASLWIFERKEY